MFIASKDRAALVPSRNQRRESPHAIIQHSGNASVHPEYLDSLADEAIPATSGNRRHRTLVILFVAGVSSCRHIVKPNIFVLPAACLN
jgi:hypothetical protein